MSALRGISAAGSASLEIVAGPIGAALVATGVGIAVAVPAVLVYIYFLRRLKLTSADLDDFAHYFYSLAQKHSFRVLLHPAQKKIRRHRDRAESEGGVLRWPFPHKTAMKC